MSIAERRRAAPPFNIFLAIICAEIGACLFALLVTLLGIGASGGPGVYPGLAFLLTPVFILPVAVYAITSRRMGIFGLIVLTILLTVSNCTAQQTAALLYDRPDAGLLEQLTQSADKLREQAADQPALREISRASAMRAGGVASALGAFFTFAWMLLLGPAYWSWRNVWLCLGATVVLTVIGAYGMGDLPLFGRAAHLPHERPPEEWALRVFLPWQLVFGLAVAMLIASRKPIGFKGPAGSSARRSRRSDLAR